MPVLPIGLAILAVLHDTFLRGGPTGAPLLAIACGVALPFAVPLLLWRLQQRGAVIRVLRWHGRSDAVLVCTAGLALAAGWLDLVRRAAGDWPLIDELLAAGPTLLAFAACSVAAAPARARVRMSQLLDRSAAGLPLNRPPSLARQVALDVRLRVLLMGVPLALLLAAQETLLLPAVAAALGPATRATLGLLLPLAVLITVPALLVRVLDTVPLPAGSTRYRLRRLDRQLRTRTRRFRLWRTDHHLANAAVIGVMPPLRYVLLTDALIESLSPDELLAVTAHELGHVRHRHLVWLLIAVVVSLSLPLAVLARTLALPGLLAPQAAEAAALALSVAAFLPAFGWVSRRFEQQADAEAVRAVAGARVVPEDTLPLAHALMHVVRSAGVAPDRRGYRHGSIRSRIANLRALIGHPPHRLPIDRTVRRIKNAALLGAAATVLIEWLLPFGA